MIEIKVVETIEQMTGLKDAWAKLVQQDANSVHGMGITGTLDWTLSLWECHLQSQPQRVIVLEDEGEICAILPCHLSVNSGNVLKERVIQPISELYSGRTGFLVKNASPHYLDALLAFVYDNVTGWDTLKCTLVDGSHSAKMFADVMAKRNQIVSVGESRQSPYIVLPDEFVDYIGGLPKSLREDFKKSERRLGKLGVIDVRHYQNQESVAEFFSEVLAIERLSWKESSETSITTNPIQEELYRRFLTRSAERGWMLGTVLRVGHKPIAYAMGFVFENIYYTEKTSYDESVRNTGAGSYIYLPILEELYRRGVRIFDFMGSCEEYKMRWTQSIYNRRTWILYNTSLRGRLVRAKHSVDRALQRDHSLQSKNAGATCS